MSKQLNVRDPRAANLAKKLGQMRGQSMIEATIYVLEAAIRQETERMPVAARLAAIARGLRAKAGPSGREMTRDEIHAMWAIDEVLATVIESANSRYTSPLVPLKTFTKLASLVVPSLES